MPTYLIRVEAVNFEHFVFDTNDISTIRGGGLLLLDPAKQLRNRGLALHEIYSGASTALFEADLDPADIPTVCETIRAALQEGQRKEATFVVDAQATSKGTFKADHAAVVAKNRWGQLQSPCVVLPPSAPAPCTIDRVRPGPARLYRKGAGFSAPEDRAIAVSTATYDRRTNGLQLKRELHRDIYRRCRQAECDFEFVNDLEELATFRGAGKLDGKIAVIYVDGNGFGQILRDCISSDKVQAWSKLLSDNQEAFLAWLLSVPGEIAPALKPGECTEWFWAGDAVANNGHKIRKEKALRLETLLWGGDEMIWIVPAWVGWWVLERFFALYGGQFDPYRRSFDPDGRGERRLTHSASLVFCHHNAPITRIIDLTKKLTETAKELKSKGSYLAYQILESFDHLGGDPHGARQSLLSGLGNEIAESSLLLRGENMGELHKIIGGLKDCVPRSVLFEVVGQVFRDRKTLTKDQLMKPITRSERAGVGAKQMFEALCAMVAPAHSGLAENTRIALGLLHLVELWDYIVPVTARIPEGGAR